MYAESKIQDGILLSFKQWPKGLPGRRRLHEPINNVCHTLCIRLCHFNKIDSLTRLTRPNSMVAKIKLGGFDFLLSQSSTARSVAQLSLWYVETSSIKRGSTKTCLNHPTDRYVVKKQDASSLPSHHVMAPINNITFHRLFWTLCWKSMSRKPSKGHSGKDNRCRRCLWENSSLLLSKLKKKTTKTARNIFSKLQNKTAWDIFPNYKHKNCKGCFLFQIARKHS